MIEIDKTISVVIPVFNSDRFIMRLLKILELQLDMIYELIFIDDGSSDTSLELLETWKKGKENVKVIAQKRSGASVARQTGLDLVRSKYVSFVDSDDIITHDYFEQITGIVSAEPNCDMFVFSYNTFFSNKHVLPRINKKSIYENAREYVKSIGNGDTIGDAALWNHVYNVDFLRRNSIHFDLSAKIAEDCLFNDMCALFANKIYVSDFCGYTWMCDHNSLTTRCPLNMGETLKKHNDYIIMINKKYCLGNLRIGETEKWAFSYLVENILNSSYDRTVKNNLLKEALQKNISEETISNYFSGLEKIFLKQSYFSRDFRYYNFYLKYNTKSLISMLKKCVHTMQRRTRID